MSEPSAQNNQRITLEIFYCSIIVIVSKKSFKYIFAGEWNKREMLRTAHHERALQVC